MDSRHSAPRTPPPMVDLGQLALGVGALVVGLGVYLLARPRATTDFLPVWLSSPVIAPGSMAPVTGWLPTLAHTAGFGLLTAAVLGGGRRATLVACTSWVLVNLTFEVVQQPGVADRFGLSHWHAGTFAITDLLAALAGGGAALFASSIRAGRHPRRVVP